MYIYTVVVTAVNGMKFTYEVTDYRTPDELYVDRARVTAKAKRYHNRLYAHESAYKADTVKMRSYRKIRPFVTPYWEH